MHVLDQSNSSMHLAYYGVIQITPCLLKYKITMLAKSLLNTWKIFTENRHRSVISKGRSMRHWKGMLICWGTPAVNIICPLDTLGSYIPNYLFSVFSRDVLDLSQIPFKGCYVSKKAKHPQYLTITLNWSYFQGSYTSNYAYDHPRSIESDCTPRQWQRHCWTLEHGVSRDKRRK